MGLKGCAAHYLGICIRLDCAFNILATWDHCFFSVDGKSSVLCSLFKCHCVQNYRMGYTLVP